MKLIIAGSRNITVDSDFIISLCLLFKIKPQEIVSGTAKGIDKSGENFYYHMKRNGSAILGLHSPPVDKIKRFYPDWNKYNKAAGHIRNKQMAEYADALLLIWDGESRGSANMKENMQKIKKPIYEIILRSENNLKEENI